MASLNYDDIYQKMTFLNVTELKYICDVYGISYNILYNYNNKLKKSGYMMPKSTIINKLIEYLKNPNIEFKDVIIKKKLINFDKIGDLKKEDNIYFGQYKNGNKKILKLIKELTNDEFKFGAISCFIIRNALYNNILMTYDEFSHIYMRYVNEGFDYGRDALQYINYDGDNWKRDRLDAMREIYKIYKI
tara:strand:- start:50 stop:616 length:567 start_codon:yes stop_codon:yes gene_type:complete